MTTFHERTRDRACGQDITDLLGGVDIFDLNSRILVRLVKQPNQIHTLGSGDLSHGRAPAFYDHLDHRIVVFRKKKRCPLA